MLERYSSAEKVLNTDSVIIANEQTHEERVLKINDKQKELKGRKRLRNYYEGRVRSHLEYANSVWYPKRKSHIDKLERVQKRATKLIPELSKISYTDRLKALNLPTLKYRRYRGDMIELFKIIKGIYDYTFVPYFDIIKLSEDSIRTRSNRYRLLQTHCHYDLRKLNFSNRGIPVWNSLPDYVVCAETVNTFKNRLVQR